MFPLRDNIPTLRFPLVTVAIIAVNLLVFFGFQGARLSLRGASVNENTVVRYGAIPYELTHPGKSCGLVAAAHVDQLGTPVHETAVVACEGAPGIPPGYRAPARPNTWLTALSSMFMQGGCFT